MRANEGTVDAYLADFKYADAELARRYSHAPDYPEVALAALEAMVEEAGGPTFDEDVYKRQAKKKGAGLSVSLATWVACSEQKLRDLAEAYAAFRGLKLLGVSFE